MLGLRWVALCRSPTSIGRDEELFARKTLIIEISLMSLWLIAGEKSGKNKKGSKWLVQKATFRTTNPIPSNFTKDVNEFLIEVR